MKTVRFVRDTDPQREGGPGFKAGEAHSLRPSSARRWVLRGAAVYEADAKPSKLKLKEDADGDAVVSPAADVAGADSVGAGERAEPDAGPAVREGGGGSGRGGRGGNKHHGHSATKK